MADLIHRYKVDVYGIQETKMEVVDGGVLRSVGGGRLDDMAFKPLTGASGGILLCWNSGAWKKLDQSIGRFYVSILLIHPASGWKWCVSNVYGPQESVEREEMWRELAEVQMHGQLRGASSVTLTSQGLQGTGTGGAA
ncbi:hypothetical protein QJS10_CPA05g01347 [Acorus calamus]|uniref:Endonuclease/exonuclease/phosphatase domain-containing protein n=1 Tax=Acorus calamus TaxID=4465 RepID=A0AAV9ES10_ACOCL|nr:hypothetical protein QJS10_CPA05g01347 [Acorus calamus]